MPPIRLTDAKVPKLQAKDGRRTDYRDAIVPGLVLRVSPSGVRSWSVEYHEQRSGRRASARHTLGRYPRLDLDAAREAARAYLERTGQIHGRDADLTVSKLVAHALAAATLRPATRKEWERLHRKLISPPPFGALVAATVRRGDVLAWRRPIAERSGWIANNVHAVLRWAYRWAIAQDILDRDPTFGIPKAMKEQPRERVLNTDELRALLDALDASAPRQQAAGDVVRLLLLTGARLSMVLGMRRDELELAGPEPQWAVPGPRMKKGRPHVVPLSPAALAVVERRLAAVPAGFQHLFPRRASRAHGAPLVDRARGWGASEAWELRRRVEEAHGATVPPWTIHGLRHTIATTMAERLGISTDEISLILAHVVGSRITRIYERSTRLAARRAALVAWAEWLDRLRELAGDKVVPFRGRS